MKLFLPSARTTNLLLIVGFCSIGYALYMRYMVIEQAGVGLACQGGLDTWLCFSRKIVIPLYRESWIGLAAIVIAALNLLRPSLVLLALGLALSGLGVVLYNANTAGLAAALLVLSLARRAPASE